MCSTLNLRTKTRSAALAESCAFLAQRNLQPNQLDFSQVLSEEFLQFGRSGNDERVAFDAQHLLVTKVCQGARQRFARCSHLSGEHALGSVEFDFNLRCAAWPWAL